MRHAETASKAACSFVVIPGQCSSCSKLKQQSSNLNISFVSPMTSTRLRHCFRCLPVKSKHNLERKKLNYKLLSRRRWIPMWSMHSNVSCIIWKENTCNHKSFRQDVHCALLETTTCGSGHTGTSAICVHFLQATACSPCCTLATNLCTPDIPTLNAAVGSPY